MPLSLAAATAIAAGANVIGSGLNAWQSRRNVRDTNIANVKQSNIAYDRNKELAQYTFDKNLEMWKMQNKYNAPSSQMQRLQEAGLNPHLMYGQGTVGNAQGAPQMQQTPYVAPRMDYSGRQPLIGSMAQAGLGTMAQMYDIDLKKEQLNQSVIQTQYERMFKIPLGEISIQTAASNLNQTQIINGIKQYEQDIQKIKLEDYWKKGSNPNDPALYREGLNIIKQVLENTSTDVAKNITQQISPLINTISNALEAANFWTKTAPQYIGNEIKREWNETQTMYQEFINWYNNWRSNGIWRNK
ncbi:hypothetical protein [Flavobacterium sp.]|uniref:hypothetical protein n=1 Tax=Flavobacterium sp. TaxID=239 RepID=UPI004047E58D